MIERLKKAGQTLLPGALAVIVLATAVFAYHHRQDHALLHALIVREEARIRAAQAEQQQLQSLRPPAPKVPDVTTPEKPPIASSPVPEPGKK